MLAMMASCRGMERIRRPAPTRSSATRIGAVGTDSYGCVRARGQLRGEPPAAVTCGHQDADFASEAAALARRGLNADTAPGTSVAVVAGAARSGRHGGGLRLELRLRQPPNPPADLAIKAQLVETADDPEPGAQEPWAGVGGL